MDKTTPRSTEGLVKSAQRVFPASVFPSHTFRAEYDPRSPQLRNPSKKSWQAEPGAGSCLSAVKSAVPLAIPQLLDSRPNLFRLNFAGYFGPQRIL